ncbi:MAG: hypothetical protein E7317_02720 [Clostridiales bacterium]|nr:hypothetical protein [Clostridiales bacterium]
MRKVYFAPIIPLPAPRGFGPALEAHWERLRAPARRRASLAAWMLLSLALEEHGLEPGEVALLERGKPVFPDGRICFSLSHDEALCAVSLSEAPTGVDVERADRALSPSLIRRLDDADPVGRWCAWEACLKCSGEGWTRTPDGNAPARPAASLRVRDPQGSPHVIAAAFENAQEPVEWIERRFAT